MDNNRDINVTVSEYILFAAREAAHDFAKPKGEQLYSDYYYVFTQEELDIFLKLLKKFGGKESDIAITNVYGDCNDEFYCYQIGLK